MVTSYELDQKACERLLRGGVVGRVAVSTPSGPHILPVNYSVVGDAIILRTESYGLLGTYGRGNLVAFEVDWFDFDRHRGWSVLARGRASAITDPDEIKQIFATWAPRPWADGPRGLFLKLPWTELSGRHLGGSPGQHPEMPVRRVIAGS